jgi:hypothetical protein
VDIGNNSGSAVEAVWVLFGCITQATRSVLDKYNACFHQMQDARVALFGGAGVQPTWTSPRKPHDRAYL